MFGKSPTNAFQSGANNPMYGKVAANAMTVNVYSINNKLVHSFTSQVAAANWLNIPRSTFKGYLKSGRQSRFGTINICLGVRKSSL
jgi:hypothetical protein